MMPAFPETLPTVCEDEVLLNDWFPVGYSSDFEKGKIAPVRLLDRDLIAWRDDAGEIHVWEDLCIHRGARLSKGCIRDNQVVCPYHGWRYNSRGECTLIPAAPRETPMRKARAFSHHVAERYGFVWTCLGDNPGEIAPFPEWDDERFQKVLCGPYPYNANGYRAVENFVDATHFPFVHAGLNGVMENPDEIAPYTVEIGDEGVVSSEVRVFQPWGDARGIPVVGFYTYKCLRPLLARFSKRVLKADENGTPVDNNSEYFATLFTVQPLSATECIVRICSATDLQPAPTAEAVRERADVVFNQDRVIVETQRPERIPTHLRYELHHRTDLMGQKYRTWLRSLGITYGTI
ncbi:MAG: aromatic ring-hydroxylating dioxygenase subunit alpha [Komagataeibacter saccharivorans]|uniref:aromatic ring-hydroxylating oxygenase subunit alpha n=1 Tax=Komagataeibacter saccharivorans TaxID=265959 RepID=UPI0024A9C080|nr:aromatic ring-hydroxylating dioxygenase subunit alpha [Komagataeibacter saccharivorans]